MTDSIKILKKAFVVVYADSTSGCMYAGQPHINKRSAVIELSHHYQTVKKKLRTDGVKATVSWMTTNGCHVRTISGNTYDATILGIDLRNAVDLTQKPTASGSDQNNASSSDKKTAEKKRTSKSTTEAVLTILEGSSKESEEPKS